MCPGIGKFSMKCISKNLALYFWLASYRSHDITGETCRPNQIILGNDLGAIPPAYLKFPDYKICLGTYQSSGDSHSEYCLPRQKPESCQFSTWIRLRKNFDGVGCAPGKFHCTSKQILDFLDFGSRYLVRP